MSKLIRVVVPGANDSDVDTRRDTLIDEDTLASDVLESAGFSTSDFVLEVMEDHEEETFRALGKTEKVYSLVEDQEKLFVRPSDMVVGIVV